MVHIAASETEMIKSETHALLWLILIASYRCQGGGGRNTILLRDHGLHIMYYDIPKRP